MQAIYDENGRRMTLKMTCMQCMIEMDLIEEDESGDAIGIFHCGGCKNNVDAYLEY